mgnify:CR=1 FL=1
MQMRRSRVLERLHAGQAAFSVKLNSSDARVAEIAAMSGIGCIWVDAEHTANDWSVIEKHIHAAKIYDVDTLVVYGDATDPVELIQTVEALKATVPSLRVQREPDPELTCRAVVRLDKREDNA